LRIRAGPGILGLVKRSLVILLVLALHSLHLAADDLPAHQLVLELYDRGEYSDCRGLTRRMIDDYAAGIIEVPVAEMARVYLVAACLEDVFRDAGYAEAVDDNLRIALEMDPNVGDSIAGSRPFVAARFEAIRADLLTAQGPTGRRFSLGFVLGAEGPGGIHWRNVPSFGLRLGAGVLQWLTIEAGALLPVQESPLDEVELYLGGTMRSAFVLNRPMLVLNASYVAVHEGGWSHGLSLGAGAEIAMRSGVSFRCSVELLRIEGAEPPDPDPTDFPSFSLFGAPVTLSLPRISLSVAYSF
jgi:hypothetical protein